MHPDGTAQPEDLSPVEDPVKVCQKCSVQTRTLGLFCPQCGSSYAGRSPGWFSRNRRTAIAALVILLLVAGGIGVAEKISHDHARKVAAAQALQREAATAKSAADAAAAKAKAAQAAALAKSDADNATRAERKVLVTALEASVLKDAKAEVATLALDGPILRASCTPVGGGSTDDLTALTGAFECIAVNKDNADGTASGYRFSATINWNDSSYSWHLGS
jgi:hypothetical protein